MEIPANRRGVFCVSARGMATERNSEVVMSDRQTEA
jgi:hypothetical protein